MKEVGVQVNPPLPTAEDLQGDDQKNKVLHRILKFWYIYGDF